MLWLAPGLVIARKSASIADACASAVLVHLQASSSWERRLVMNAACAVLQGTWPPSGLEKPQGLPSCGHSLNALCAGFDHAQIQAQLMH